MEIWENVFKATKGAVVSLADVAPVKAAAAGVFAFSFGSQGIALMAFIVLILIDLTTKWMSLSYSCLVDQGVCQERAGLWQCIKAMPIAFKQRYITSEMMKTKFAGKLILYMVLVAAAVHIDVMAGGNGVFLKASWYYLAATEAISIIENLRDAGVQSLDPILAFIRNKLGGMK
ncbi:MAG: Holin toxin secretion/phage lysis [Firmicutes bacterium]|nr:Holin toxin secretion/phage lysis [Bacillota bacterium]